MGAEKAGSTEEEQEWQVPRVECTSGWNGQQAGRKTWKMHEVAAFQGRAGGTKEKTNMGGRRK